jgi:hypothetical protein
MKPDVSSLLGLLMYNTSGGIIGEGKTYGNDLDVDTVNRL